MGHEPDRERDRKQECINNWCESLPDKTDMQRARTDTELREIRVTDVHEGDAPLDADGAELVCTDETVGLPAEGISIPNDDIESTRVDVDKSVAGFTVIAGAFGVVGLLMGYVFVQFVILGGGPFLSVVGAGSGLSSVLSVFGFFWIRRLEVGERKVLQVDCVDGSRFVFITDDDNGSFEEIESRVASS